MKKIFKNLFLALSFSVFLAAPMVVVAAPLSVSAAGVAECEKSFLGIPPWYRGLTEKRENVQTKVMECHLVDPSTLTNKLQSFITIIILNVIQIGLTIVGIAAFFFMLYGGFQFLTGGSNPSQVEAARKSILNAAIGLVISFGAVAIVNLVFGVLKP